MQPAAYRMRPLGIVDQLDVAFRLYRRQFLTFIGIAAALQIPLAVLTLAVQVRILLPLGDLGSGAAADPEHARAILNNTTETTCINVLLAIAAAVATYLVSGALAHAVSEAYHGRRTDIVGAYDFMLHGRRFAGLLIASLIAGLLTGLGYLCLIIPGIYLQLRWMLVPQVIVLENRGPSDGLGRAANLAEGHLWRAFGLQILTYLVSYFLPGALTALVQFAVLAVSDSIVLYTVLSSALSTILSVAMLPIVLGAQTIFYYDLRIRKEGYDLEVQAEQFLAQSVAA